MSSRELIVLGTASQAPTRYRAHNSYALRWDDQLILFDPGEGTQRQCTLAGVAIARATAVCITHFHGDHCLGLPGVIQRRALDARANPNGLPALPVFFPADGEQYFERMRTASIFHDTSNLDPRPIKLLGRSACSVHSIWQQVPWICLLYTSPSPRDATLSRMPSSA